MSVDKKMTAKGLAAKGARKKKTATITSATMKRYFGITGEAIAKVKASPMDQMRKKIADDYLDMAERYYADAHHFFMQGNFVLAYGALNYAHAWLDAGARIGVFKVKDSRLFTVDD